MPTVGSGSARWSRTGLRASTRPALIAARRTAASIEPSTSVAVTPCRRPARARTSGTATGNPAKLATASGVSESPRVGRNQWNTGPDSGGTVIKKGPHGLREKLLDSARQRGWKSSRREPWMANQQPVDQNRAIRDGSGLATDGAGGLATDGAGDAYEINMAERDQAGGHRSIFATGRR